MHIPIDETTFGVWFMPLHGMPHTVLVAKARRPYELTEAELTYCFYCTENADAWNAVLGKDMHNIWSCTVLYKLGSIEIACAVIQSFLAGVVCNSPYSEAKYEPIDELVREPDEPLDAFVARVQTHKLPQMVMV